MKQKTILFIIVVLLLLLLFLYLRETSYNKFNRYIHRNDWKAETSPLQKETVDLLCNNLELDTDHTLCNGNKDVYAQDFLYIIMDTFQPYEAYQISSDEAATYDEVNEKMGDFLYGCGTVEHQTDGFSFFVCDYDLSGDKEFPIRILYTYPEKATVRINMRLPSSEFGIYPPYK